MSLPQAFVPASTLWGVQTTTVHFLWRSSSGINELKDLSNPYGQGTRMAELFAAGEHVSMLEAQDGDD